ncbi:MAG: hypothetical protein P8X63_06860 [Desulfuromonadaceae bacterium]
MLEKLEDKLGRLELFDADFGLTSDQILKKLASQLGGAYDSGEIKVIRNEREYLIYNYSSQSVGSKVGSPPYFEMKTKIPYAHSSFGVRKSDHLDWVAEHLLFMPDHQVGDAAFDSNFYIKVGTEDWARKFFHKDSVKQIITKLLKEFDLIRAEDGYLKVIKYQKTCSLYSKSEIISDAIEQINRVILDFPTEIANEVENDKCNNTKINISIRNPVKENKELIFGKYSDKKSIQRLTVVVIIIFIVAAFAYGRLFLHIINSFRH